MPVSSRFFVAALLSAALSAPVAAYAAKPPAVAPSDTLTSTLAGEYALQAGRLEEAADWYLQAARSADGDAGLAERATRISLLANDNARSAQALKLWRARAPGSLAMQSAQATLSLRNKDLAAARRDLESLMRSSDPEGWRYAIAALGGGARDPKSTGTLLGQLIDAKAVPNQLPAWLALGGLAQRLDQPQLAERVVDDVIARFPGEPRVALLRASQLREAGKLDEARKALLEVEDSARLIPQLRFAIAAEYDALGDAKAAEGLLARGPQNDDTWRLRAALLAKAEDKVALAALYQELKRESSSPDPGRRLLLGQTAEILERHDEALDWYASVPGGPQRAQARLRSAKVLHDLKRTADAYADLRKLQADAGIDDEARRDAYLMEAELRAEDHDDVGELDAYARGLAAYPDEGALLYARALMWERRDDIAHSEADLRKILIAEPDNIGALNALGYTLADRTTRYAEALELIDRARVAEPGNGAIIDSYGWVLYRLGRKEEALVELRRAMALQKDPEIAAHLGEVLWMSGNKDEARKYFDEARKLDPDNRSLQRALKNTGA